MVKIFWLPKSDRAAKYWAMWALCADTRVCERFEYAAWRLHSMDLASDQDLGIVWEHQRSYRRIQKTYKFGFETDEVILTIEGRLPVDHPHVVHPTMESRWFPVNARVHSYLEKPVFVHFGEDHKVSHVDL